MTIEERAKYCVVGFTGIDKSDHWSAEERRLAEQIAAQIREAVEEALAEDDKELGEITDGIAEAKASIHFVKANLKKAVLEAYEDAAKIADAYCMNGDSCSPQDNCRACKGARAIRARAKEVK